MECRLISKGEAMTWLIVVQIVLFVLFFNFLISGEEYTSKERNVIATVTRMEYTPAQMVPVMHYNPALKMPMTMYVPCNAKYEVTISFEYTSETYDNQELYDSLDVGKRLDMTLVSFYDKKGHLKKRHLQFPR